MSLLEDVFLEDEAGEAQELERVIEGDEYDERPRPSTPDSNENSEKEDEAEEDKRAVEPASGKPRRMVKNPRVTLNPARLTGPRGIHLIPEHFNDFKFKGKGHEREDLDVVLKTLEHWAYRLYPKFQFSDCLKKIESLGNKRPVMVHLTKIRTDQFTSDETETVVQRDSSDEEAPQPVEDEFDQLLRQQIELARSTPGVARQGFTTPAPEKSVAMAKATYAPSINDEQRERMLRNKQMAEERRLARLKLNNPETGYENPTSNTETRDVNSVDNTLKDNLNDSNVSKGDVNYGTIEKNATNTANITTGNENLSHEEAIDYLEGNISKVKSNRSNVIDSSDSDDDGLVINESVTVDVHNHRNYDCDEGSDIHHQNGNDNDMNSDIVHQSEIEETVSCVSNQNLQSKTVLDLKSADNESSSDIFQHENEQNHSDIDLQNKNNAGEIRVESNEVEMNDIGDLDEYSDE